jgi:hypothetical protein
MSKTYRFLKPGEVLRSSDEFNGSIFFEDDGWRPAAEAGRAARAGQEGEYRRPLPEPGPAYRLLNVGETIQPGDEFRNLFRDIWSPTYNAGRSISGADEGYYRRPLPITPDVEPVDVEALVSNLEAQIADLKATAEDHEAHVVNLQARVADLEDRLLEQPAKPATEPVASPVTTEYRMLELGETVKAGDEYDDDEWGWVPSYRAHSGNKLQYFDEGLYRRKVEQAVEEVVEQTAKPAAQKYLILGFGQEIRSGDEFNDLSEGRDNWVKSRCSGGTLGTGDVGLYRRKVTPQPSPSRSWREGEYGG